MGTIKNIDQTNPGHRPNNEIARVEKRNSWLLGRTNSFTLFVQNYRLLKKGFKSTLQMLQCCTKEIHSSVVNGKRVQMTYNLCGNKEELFEFAISVLGTLH